jgi:hypothetical protein
MRRGGWAAGKLKSHVLHRTPCDLCCGTVFFGGEGIGLDGVDDTSCRRIVAGLQLMAAVTMILAK